MSTLLTLSKVLIKAIRRTECGGKPDQALSTIGHREEIVTAHGINKTRDLCMFQYKRRCSKERYVILNQPFQGPEMEATGISREILLQFRKPLFLPSGTKP